MSSPLLTRDCVALRAAHRPLLQRRAARWAIPAAVGAVVVLHAQTAASPACTDAAPCEPQPLQVVAIGLLFAAACVGSFAPWLAAWFAALFVLTLAPAEQLMAPSTASPAWSYVVDVALVALCAAIARIGPWRNTADSVAWSKAVTRTALPPEAARPLAELRPPGRVGRGAAAALVVLGLALAALGLYQQTAGDARQAAGSRANAVVVGNPDEASIIVRLANGTDATLSVVEAADHPIGQRLAVVNDGKGFVQLVSEPYDVTGWLFLAVVLVGVGVAVWWRVGQSVWRRSELAGDDVPVCSVYVVFEDDRAIVYATDVRPGEAPVATIDGFVVGAIEEPDRALRSGRLYGYPIPGAWCLVEADGLVLVPIGPLAERLPTVVPQVSAEAVHPQSHPLRPEEAAEVASADRVDNPHQVHSHRQSRLAALGLASCAPLILVGPLSWLNWPYLAWLAVAAVAGALSFRIFAGWLLSLRVAWNGAGIAVSSQHGELIREPWPAVTLIESGSNVITIHIGQLAVPVPILTFARLQRGQRSAQELARALRFARERALTWPSRDVDLPRAGDARATWLVPVVGVAYVFGLAWLLQVVADGL